MYLTCTYKKEGPSWRARAHAKFSDLHSDISGMCPASPARLTLSLSPFPGGRKFKSIGYIAYCLDLELALIWLVDIKQHC